METTLYVDSLHHNTTENCNIFSLSQNL